MTISFQSTFRVARAWLVCLCLVFPVFANATTSEDAPILILGAVPQEVPYIVERLENMTEGKLYGFRYWRGQLGTHEVIVSLTSVGKAYTSMCTALFIETFHPKAAFMCGTASRTNPEKRTGDIVIPKALFFHDYGSLTETDIEWSDMYQPGTRIPLSRILPVTAEMRTTAAELLADYTPHEVTVDGTTYPITIDLDGIVATADLFGVRQARIDQLQTNEVDLMEMESAAFALTCLQMKIPYLVVRAGSNLSQPKPNKDYLIYGPIAAESAATLTHYLASHWPEERNQTCSHVALSTCSLAYNITSTERRGYNQRLNMSARPKK